MHRKFMLGIRYTHNNPYKCVTNIGSLEKIYNKTGISTRGLDRIIKLSVTIMDLNKENVLTKGHIYEAISYRKNINGEVI